MTAAPSDFWNDPTAAAPLDPDAALGGSGYNVGDFWRWGFSDLRLNVTRGVLAEFLVAKALGDEKRVRHAWDNYDVMTPAGIRVEVKSSAYVQSWRQTRPSRITFSGLTGLTWSDTAGWGESQEVRADVFVFAVHTAETPEAYEPLNVGQWSFYVLSAAAIVRHGGRSISLATLKQLDAMACGWRDLGRAVERAAAIPPS